jgi:hypothetical protein
MAFNQSPEAAINAKPKASDSGVLSSINDAMAWGTHAAQEAWIQLPAPSAKLPEFQHEAPGVDKQGVNFADADKALAGGSIYAGVFNNKNTPQQPNLEGADATLDDWYHGKFGKQEAA